MLLSGQDKFILDDQTVKRLMADKTITWTFFLKKNMKRLSKCECQIAVTVQSAARGDTHIYFSSQIKTVHMHVTLDVAQTLK